MTNPIKFYPLLPSHEYIDTPIDSVNRLLSQLDKSFEDAIYTYELVIDFLKENGQNPNAYRKLRSDINIFLNWCWFVRMESPQHITRVTMREFVDYCNTPDPTMVATGRVRQHLLTANGDIYFNDKWKPFVQTNTSKAYLRQESSLKSSLSIISSLYKFFIEEDYCDHNPAHSLLNKLNASTTRVGAVDDEREKALNDNQIVAVLRAAEDLAASNPEQHERTLFLINLMLHCYPRISEVAARVAYTPTMSNFRRVRNTDAWVFYVPKSKGNKSRSIMCPNELIEALKRYRAHLGLSSLLPTSNDDHPLFIRHKPAQHGRDKGMIYSTLGIEQLSSIIKSVFAVASLYVNDLDDQEQEELKRFTPHSLRHTGITCDVIRGMDLHEIAANSGHGDLNTLAHYISNRPENRIKSAFNKKLPREYKALVIKEL
jgi:integrase